ncbi:hypothetical protein FisN_1Hh579 [Fistulifera solaris]|uniref:C2 domain-containing protein n=1 Tax=Fistulifera solaris TaxID=1519565 RepID=A0A1Z5KQP3_FISSO|nr:hypothetical protein FisN_1Hh579 [Fistulifera solaris]|eukprot:GAX28630.1 hypothetical protein FisN_1Hh579 [Fistulifera solaris]
MRVQIQAVDGGGRPLLQRTEAATASERKVSFRPELGNQSNPVSLDGCLYCRRGNSGRVKRRYVSLSFTNGGSIKIFTDVPDTENEVPDNGPARTVLRNVYSRLQRSLSYAAVIRRMESLELYIPCDIQWIAKDVANDPCLFEVEVPSTEDTLEQLNDLYSEYNQTSSMTETESVKSGIAHDRHDPVDELRKEVAKALAKNKPFRIQFRCSKGSHEKALWLKALSKVERLSSESIRKKTFFGTLTAPWHSKDQNQVRRRRESSHVFAADTRDLDISEALDDPINQYTTKDVERLIRGSNSRYVRDKEYRVLPSYAYPHRWMTRKELHEEMVLPSEKFHDLRIPSCTLKEIGSLRVEVLQCFGLPKLDRTSDTDAVVYLVCGSYAFATDVIPNRINPIWLRKCRRACDFPIFHGYARLYVGVFDDDNRREKDDFAGRVAIDLARLRPSSTYDVTLPLRLSTHVYSRRKRGAIRLRFTLNWKSERDALLSYIPKSLKIPLPQHTKPDVSVTVNCSDEKAFRNIAITVHGAHLPGRFTFHQMRASIRELNFTRKFIFLALRHGFWGIRHWVNPSISGFIFLSWMHCIYMNSFSLVPAYMVLYFVLFLMRTYVIYGIEIPLTTGFIPPSWEEMFMAFCFGSETGKHVIEPLSLGRVRAFTSKRNADQSMIDLGPTFKTHSHHGIALFKMLGLFKDPSVDEEENRTYHFEFPYSNDYDYPKFGARECLVDHKGEREKSTCQSHTGEDAALVENIDEHLGVERRGSIGARFPIDMHNLPNLPIDVNIPDLMRKDISGMKEYDEEENNFTAGRAVVGAGRKAAKTVKRTGRKAAAQLQSAATKTGVKLQTAATELTEMTGLNHVVNPIQKGLTHGLTTSSAMVSNRVIAPIQQRSYPLRYRAAPRIRRGHSDDTMMQRANPRPGRYRRAYSADESEFTLSSMQPTHSTGPGEMDHINDGFETHSMPSSMSAVTPDEVFSEDYDPLQSWPEQNIDVEGPSTGKKLTDDLLDIKDKVHELTWHCFDDQPYFIPRRDTLYFGDSKKPERKRKDAKKKLDKLLNVAQYSHSNPFIARLGLYVEPIIGSLYSFLCLFRAAFNIATWQDPMFTFLLSLFSLCLSVVLFIFPWRLFLFIFGFWLVGPQNWAVRILRERGHLPPARKHFHEDTQAVDPKLRGDQPVFTSKHRKGGHDIEQSVATDIDSREIHGVVVPYKPLMYQRFFDWPPEPLFAEVQPDTTEARRQKMLSNLTKGARRGPQRRPSILFYRSGSMDSQDTPDRNGAYHDKYQ